MQYNSRFPFPRRPDLSEVSSKRHRRLAPQFATLKIFQDGGSVGRAQPGAGIPTGARLIAFHGIGDGVATRSYVHNDAVRGISIEEGIQKADVLLLRLVQ